MNTVYDAMFHLSNSIGFGALWRLDIDKIQCN